MLDLTLPHLR